MARTEPQTSPDHPEIRSRFEAYADEALPPEQAQEIEEHLLSCAACEAAFEEFVRRGTPLSGLHKMPAPPDLGKEVAETIHRRSQGRFFGRRAFGDRVPFPLLAALVFAIALAVYYFIWRSDTGSLKLHDDPVERKVDDSVKLPGP